MTISDKGIFEDEEQYRAFGEKIKELFGNPIAIAESVESAEIELDIPADRTAKYLVVREDITEGQRVRAFSILADDKEIYSSNCIGHKRIVPLGDIKAEKITFRVTESACGFALRDVAVY